MEDISHRWRKTLLRFGIGGGWLGTLWTVYQVIDFFWDLPGRIGVVRDLLPDGPDLILLLAIFAPILVGMPLLIHSVRTLQRFGFGRVVITLPDNQRGPIKFTKSGVSIANPMRNWTHKQALDWIRNETAFGKRSSEGAIWAEFTQRAFDRMITVWARPDIGFIHRKSGPTYALLDHRKFRTHKIEKNPYHDIVEVSSDGDAQLMVESYSHPMFCMEEIQALDWS